jgi:hypothetical protein
MPHKPTTTQATGKPISGAALKADRRLAALLEVWLTTRSFTPAEVVGMLRDRILLESGALAGYKRHPQHSEAHQALALERIESALAAHPGDPTRALAEAARIHHELERELNGADGLRREGLARALATSDLVLAVRALVVGGTSNELV